MPRANPTPRYKALVEHAPTGPVVVLSPHLDDAVLSAWSVLTGPAEVIVVNVFAGVPPDGPPPRWDRMLRATDSRDLVRARIAEDEEALALAGRTPVNLDFLDAQYRSGDPGPGAVETALADLIPQAAALHAPAAIGGHRDHELARELALGLGDRDAVPVSLYADLPYAARFGWPAWVTGEEPDERLDPEVDWELALEAAPVARERLVPAVTRLDESAVARKREAVRAYRTQFTALNQGPIGLLDHPRVLPFEVSWALEQTGT
jgi:LmbE family N-acetylglucosaminyl deacetylase